MAMIKTAFIICLFLISSNTSAQEWAKETDSILNRKYSLYEDVCESLQKDTIKNMAYMFTSRTSVLPDLSAFTEMEALIVNGNRLKIRPDLFKHPNLKILDLEFVKKIQILDDIDTISGIEFLFLPHSYGKFYKKMPEFVYSLHSLKRLNIAVKDSNSIDFLRLAENSSIISLHISVKNIDKLPSRISCLDSLVELGIYTSNDFELTNYIIKLSKLKFLFVTASLDEEMIGLLAEMEQLEGLSVDSVALRDYTKLQDINSLKWLHILRCSIELKNKVYNELPNTSDTLQFGIFNSQEY